MRLTDQRWLIARLTRGASLLLCCHHRPRDLWLERCPREPPEMAQGALADGTARDLACQARTVVQVLCTTAERFLSKVQYCFVFICIYKEHSSECESPLLFPLPFQHCPAGGPRQAGGLQCVYRATVGSPQSISQSRSRPHEWTPSRLQTDCRGHRGSWAGSLGALSEQ